MARIGGRAMRLDKQVWVEYHEEPESFDIFRDTSSGFCFEYKTDGLEVSYGYAVRIFVINFGCGLKGSAKIAARWSLKIADICMSGSGAERAAILVWRTAFSFVQLVISMRMGTGNHNSHGGNNESMHRKERRRHALQRNVSDRPAASRTSRLAVPVYRLCERSRAQGKP